MDRLDYANTMRMLSVRRGAWTVAQFGGLGAGLPVFPVRSVFVALSLPKGRRKSMGANKGAGSLERSNSSTRASVVGWGLLVR